MPQWNRDRAADSAKYPDERWRAECPRELAPTLMKYDHHTVWIDGRRALLLTYHWAAIDLENAEASLPFDVSFTYAAGHPAAPAEIQAIIDRLSFAPLAPQSKGNADLTD